MSNTYEEELKAFFTKLPTDLELPEQQGETLEQDGKRYKFHCFRGTQDGQSSVAVYRLIVDPQHSTDS